MYEEYRPVCKWLGMDEKAYSYRPMSVGKNQTASSVPNQCFGHKYLKNWNIWGSKDLNELDAMNTVKRQAYYADVNGQPVLAQKKFMTVGTFRTGKEVPLGMVSDRYKAIPDTELVDIVSHAVQDTNLEVGGSYVTDGGHTNCVLFIKNPEYRFDQGLNTGRTDNAFIGCVIRNDHVGKASCSMTAIGIREICWNFQLWGDVIGSRNIKHLSKDADIGDMTEFLMNTLLNTEPLKDAIHYIRDTAVTTDDLPYIYSGVGFSPENVESLMTYIRQLNPETRADSMTMYDVYNAATAFTTYRSGLSANGAISESKKAEELLVKNFQAIYDVGLKNLDKWRETANETQKARLPKLAAIC